MKKIILIFVCLIVLVGVGYLFAQPVPTSFWFFTQLFDTPSTYSAGKIVSVNSGATALEFTTPLSSFTGTTSITTLGTIATGVWQGTVIGTTYGGTGAANLNNLITLTTHTTGNYVKSITNGTGITGGDGGSEGAALTIAATLGTSISAGELDADVIDETKIADNGIDSEHYNDGSIDAAHLAADVIDETKIADNGIDSEHYNDDSIDDAHLNWGSETGQINLADFTHQVSGTMFHTDADGDVKGFAVGATTTVLTSQGIHAAPTWSAAGSGDITGVWTDATGDVSALSATVDDTFDARTASFTAPFQLLETSTPTQDGAMVWDSDNDYPAYGTSTTTIYGVVDGTPCIDIEGTGLSIAGGILNWAAPVNSVELATDTTGYFVGTITDAGNNTITVVGTGTEQATITLDLTADGINDTHIDWGSGANQVDLADIAGGTAPANAFDFGGSTSLELPNSADPDVDAVGEISVDSDDNSLRGFGDGVQFLYAQLTKTIQFTVAQPDDLDEKDDVPAWSNESGFSFIVTSVKAWADADDADFVLSETSATNFDTELTIASVTVSTDGTSVYYSTTAVVLASGTIESGNMIIFDPSTDDLEWLKISIIGYYDSDVN